MSMKKTKIEKLFGEYVCSDDVLKKYMSKMSYNSYIKLKSAGEELDKVTAKHVAKAIKKWALQKGAAHYSHWFMPLTNKTAEKQVSFIEINANGKMIEDFDEKSLIKGEADASSFPNGGERMTFEARGYTVWDYTSPVFIKEDKAKNKVVYIPTAFCSYNGTALDEKTPLLRATESLNNEALRVLKILGYNNVKKVNFYVGAEQEYFLIKTDTFERRLDLKMVGRTIFGCKPLMSQEECSHYFGMIEDSISDFMNDVDRELWKMGVTAKFQHNEVAPCQYEFVPIFNNVNVASDQNQIIMEVISSVAKKHNLTALFHEKPFNFVNGSGKHENWSLSTDTGLNLFDVNLKDKILFFTFFIAMIVAIDKYYKLVRLSTAYYGNDLRLGGDEAPPALISVFASEYVLNSFEELGKQDNSSKKFVLDTRVKTLPKMEKDFCDRNRTSPFAFTGNKFEFRMVGSSQAVAWPSTCICTALADVLKQMADELEGTTNKKDKLIELLKVKFEKHKRIIFNGNGYDESWKKEAEERGLIEYKDTLSVYSVLEDEDIVDLFETTKVLNRNELSLRKATILKRYVDAALLEARTMVEMLNKQILPSLNSCTNIVAAKKSKQESLNSKFMEAHEELFELCGELTKVMEKVEKQADNTLKGKLIKNSLIVLMKKIRKVYDDVEMLIPDTFEPFPTYNKILF